MPDSTSRSYDIVLFGATGFTGGLTAEYLARNAPDGCRWAISGRNRIRLEEVRERLQRLDPALADLPLLTADATDAASLAAVAEASRVVVTTVGPYLEHGEPLVAACAAAGTDYADITGEPEFVDRMYLAHHRRAVGTGARIVHCCGFESVPPDLGALLTVQQLPPGVPLAVRGVVRADATFSGGTFHSLVAQLSRTRQLRGSVAARTEVEGRPAGPRVRAGTRRPHWDAELGYWLVPLPTVDPVVVRRSGAARADYGPDFTYSHYAGFESLWSAAASALGGLVLVGAAQVPPVRNLLLRRVPAGRGPGQRRRASSWFTVELVGEGGGRRVVITVAGGDPGYGETAKMLAESALSLAFDDNPRTAGQVTPAVAMGERLTGRLIKADIRFVIGRITP